jgi:hypothetical protein
MTNSLDINPKISLTFPITETERKTALKFAQQQRSKQKQQQVYLNTLAVLVVENYLQIIDITCDLKSSYSWNPIDRFSRDVADLKITDRNVKKNGHLECRPVKAGMKVAEVPAEVWEERIAYIFVQFDSEYQTGTLLGFLPEVCNEQIPLTQLRSLESFLEFLNQPTINWLHLNDWFDNIFATGWQTVEEVINSQVANPKLAFRLGNARFAKDEWLEQQIQQLSLTSNLRGNLPSIDLDPTSALIQIIETTKDEETRWKAVEMLWEIDPNHPAAGVRRIIDLGMRLGGYPVALSVAILEKANQEVAILLRVYPMGNQDTLPSGLKLTVSESNNAIAQVEARKQPLDNYIQLKLIAEHGEKFSVMISLGDANLSEYFIV